MIGIYGGSFDPIHHGHLRAALEVCERLSLDKLFFVPCFQHPLNKAINAESQHRLAMLQLAIGNCPLFAIDQRELQRNDYSYTIETVESFNTSYPQEKLALIIGADAFLQFQQWHRWTEILDYANIVILHRPGYHLPEGDLKVYLEQHQCTNSKNFGKTSNNSIIILEMPLLEISSTYIRQQIKSGLSAQYLLPYSVNKYIVANDIYPELSTQKV
jgi:nicotinate-nucleotide adenylyltransferase